MRGLPRLILGCGALGLAACGTVPSGGGAAKTDLGEAALLAASCSGCHARGGSPEGIVSLQGIPAGQLEQKLLAYRVDREGGSAMHRMAWGYTDAQIAMIAQYLGESPGD